MIGKKVLLVIFAFALATCSEDEIPRRPYPQVLTLAVNNISDAGATFNAEIKQAGNHEIIEHGFVWSELENPTLETSEKRIVLEKVQKGVFSAEISTTLKAGVNYFVRAYAKTSEYLVYGKQVFFISLGSKAPTIHAFHPLSGTVGDTVTISGKEFSFDKNQNIVTFDSLLADVIDASDTLLQVRVPASLSNELSMVGVSILNNKRFSNQPFALTTPTITSFNPEEGMDLTAVTIQGTGFSYLLEKNIVSFGDKRATVLEANKNLLKVSAPSGISTKEVKIKVEVAEKQAISDSYFRLSPPLITDFYPKEASLRARITIEGQNFRMMSGANTVYFDAIQALVTRIISNSVLEVEVPLGVSEKGTKIKVVTAEQSAVSEDYFTLLLPEVAAISPLKANKNKEVVISGTNFSPIGGDNLVLFNGIEASILYQSKETITVLVPEGIHQADVEINISTGGHPTTPINFEYVGGNWSLEGEIFTDAARVAVACFAIGTTAYMGLGGVTEKYNQMWSFDIITGTWKKLSVFPGIPRNGQISFSINGKGYVGLGRNKDTYLNDFWEYDPGTDTWTEITPFPGTGRYVASCFVVDQKGYVGLGQTRFDTFNDFYSYDPVTRQWTQIVSFPGQARSAAASFAIGNNGYIGLGGAAGINSSDYHILSDFWRYSTTAGNWERLADFPESGRVNTSAFSIHDKGYMGMGERVDDHQISRYDDFQQYDPKSDSWTETDSNPFGPGSFGTIFTYSGKAYLLFIQRTNQLPSRQFEVFEPIY